ncbi:hypothetical protein BaRGS_00017217 [Batillaria attramentaria]|uniref:Uncharacterized protein n=1 Tax=Batillaria attramentaria TaxID=370345 RepID=A0ABD0KWN6_9CAEN
MRLEGGLGEGGRDRPVRRWGRGGGEGTDPGVGETGPEGDSALACRQCFSADASTTDCTVREARLGPRHSRRTPATSLAQRPSVAIIVVVAALVMLERQPQQS